VLAEFHRAVAAVSLSSSPEPALRTEGATREPSPGFRLGASYAAWRNAKAQLDFDIANPTAAGPPHASQNGALGAYLADDCREEGAAFSALQAQMYALALDPEAVAAAAADPAAPIRARQAEPAPACR
jgi:hypothetical protein